MKRHTPPENTVRVIALAIAFFGTLALLGWNAGVFAKLDADEQAVLAGFAAGFALLTYIVDGEVRRVADAACAATWRLLNNPVANSGPPRAGSSRPGGATVHPGE